LLSAKTWHSSHWCCFLLLLPLSYLCPSNLFNTESHDIGTAVAVQTEANLGQVDSGFSKCLGRIMIRSLINMMSKGGRETCWTALPGLEEDFTLFFFLTGIVVSENTDRGWAENMCRNMYVRNQQGPESWQKLRTRNFSKLTNQEIWIEFSDHR
jgi:hypothetical protein